MKKDEAQLERKRKALKRKQLELANGDASTLATTHRGEGALSTFAADDPEEKATKNTFLCQFHPGRIVDKVFTSSFFLFFGQSDSLSFSTGLAAPNMLPRRSPVAVQTITTSHLRVFTTYLHSINSMSRRHSVLTGGVSCAPLSLSTVRWALPSREMSRSSASQ